MSKNIEELKKEYDDIEVPKEIDFSIEKGILKGRNKRKRNNSYLGVAAGILICIMSFSIFGIREGKNSNKLYLEEPKEIELSTLGNKEKLLSILEKNPVGYRLGDMANVNITAVTAEKDSLNKSASDYSKTNNQVEGVEEEDIVNTDGEYIYSLNTLKKEVNIVKASPASKMNIVNKIKLEEGFVPIGMFIYEDYLILVGNQITPSNTKSNTIKDKIGLFSNIEKTIIYSIKDKKNIVNLRDISIEGGYVTSRITEDKLYIITSKYLYKDGILEDEKQGEVRIKDSASKEEIVNSYHNIKLLKEIASSYINITTIDLKNIQKKSVTETILGNPANIYCSNENLYIAGFNTQGNTSIYKYSLKHMKMVAQGEVLGTVLNQFSMDENNGFFRIATTKGNTQGMIKKGAVEEKSNNLFILDKDLKITGKLTDLAKGERIYSARFMGDKAYIVTFKEMDPLFVIDIKDPSNPKVLGELKIPGFSNYLHPYDENHLIGLGMETVLVNEGGEQRARPIGLKVSLFDVKDINNPKEEYKLIIGGEGSYSEATYNHKAFMFSKEKNLLSIPVNIKNGYNEIGKQGALLLNISLNGIKEKGVISHYSEGMNKSSEAYYQSFIKRTLYIEDVLYTISDSKIAAHDINTLNKISEVN